MTVLIDTNVIIDIATDDADWSEWSLAQRRAADLRGGAVINDVIFAELCFPYDSPDDVEELMSLLDLSIRPFRKESLFLAAKAFEAYKLAGGQKSNVLPDFFIGAQAAVEGLPLLTRDPQRYRSYFPQVEIIAP